MAGARKRSKTQLKRPADPTRAAIDWPTILHPELIAAYGWAAADLQDLQHAAMERRARRSVRLQRDDGVLPFDSQPVPWYSRGRWLDDEVRPGAWLQSLVGDFYIQDAGSMLALALAQAQPGEWVCDLCAAPGGKSTGLVEQLSGRGVLLSNEVIRSRLAILQTSLARTGQLNYAVSQLDPEALAEIFSGWFDCVVVDAPCSGQSMVARGKQSISAYSSSHIELNAARQERIMQQAMRLVKPGGRLVYSTCTFSYAENEAIVQRCVQEDAQWKLVDVPALAQWSVPEHPGCYRLWPHRDECSGAFAALLVHQPGQATQAGFAQWVDLAPERSRPRATAAQRWMTLEQSWDEVMPFLEPAESMAATGGQDEFKLRVRSDGRTLELFPAEFLQNACAGLYSGVTLGAWQAERLEPAYASACAKELVPRYSVELDDQQALRFVAGESLRLATEWSLPASTWVVVTWRQRPISWAKYVNGTLKNHFPKLLRQSGLRVE